MDCVWVSHLVHGFVLLSIKMPPITTPGITLPKLPFLTYWQRIGIFVFVATGLHHAPANVSLIGTRCCVVLEPTNSPYTFTTNFL